MADRLTEQILHEGPPAEEVPERMDELFGWINRKLSAASTVRHRRRRALCDHGHPYLCGRRRRVSHASFRRHCSRRPAYCRTHVLRRALPRRSAMRRPARRALTSAHIQHQRSLEHLQGPPKSTRVAGDGHRLNGLCQDARLRSSSSVQQQRATRLSPPSQGRRGPRGATYEASCGCWNRGAGPPSRASRRTACLGSAAQTDVRATCSGAPPSGRTLLAAGSTAEVDRSHDRRLSSAPSSTSSRWPCPSRSI